MESWEASEGRACDVVVTVQPTSPLVAPGDVLRAVAMLEADPKLDTVLSAAEDRHLRWVRSDGSLVPEYEARLNRQYLPETYRETGAVVACRRRVLASGSRIGEKVEIIPIPPERSVDIDSDLDFSIAEAYLSRRSVVVVIGNRFDRARARQARSIGRTRHARSCCAIRLRGR